MGKKASSRAEVRVMGSRGLRVSQVIVMTLAFTQGERGSYWMVCARGMTSSNIFLKVRRGLKQENNEEVIALLLKGWRLISRWS